MVRKLRHLKINFDEKSLNELVVFFKLKTSFDLFFRIGTGAIDNTQLKNFVSQRNNMIINFFKKRLYRAPSKELINKEEVSTKYDGLVFGQDRKSVV